MIDTIVSIWNSDYWWGFLWGIATAINLLFWAVYSVIDGEEHGTK